MSSSVIGSNVKQLETELSVSLERNIPACLTFFFFFIGFLKSHWLLGHTLKQIETCNSAKKIMGS